MLHSHQIAPRLSRHPLIYGRTCGKYAPFYRRGTASHVLQDAVDAAADGDVILVTNGWYEPIFPTLRNCLLARNLASSWGGGVTSGHLYHCTLTGNTASDSGGGTAYSTMHNCIVYFNEAPSDPNYVHGNLDHCCAYLLPVGEGNLDVDPHFADAAAGNFQLATASPCIDAGANLTEGGWTDLLGITRILDGDRDGILAADIGAYEYNPYRCLPGSTHTTSGWDVHVEGEPGRSVRVDRSRNLRDWEEVGTVTLSGSPMFWDPDASTEPHFFYRTVLLH